MTRPSDPLLKWLRAQLDSRGMNTASLATKLGMPRADVRRVLTGAEPMTVDDLLRISEAVGLTAEDMGLAGPAAAEEALDAAEEAEDGAHWGNQPEALFRLGFDLGIDFTFFVDVSALTDWGGPEDVLDGFVGKEMPIRLDAAYHEFMDPIFEERGVKLTLSFDKLYRCTFPWVSIARVLFVPFPPALPEEEEAPPEPDPDKGPPRLRLVT